jgi:hypothetical protein
MELNELKKHLYRNKPLAKIDSASKKGILYKLELDSTFIYFLVPLDDMGDGTFNHEMQAHLLIRYIYS